MSDEKCPLCGEEELGRVICTPLSGWAEAHPCITFKCGTTLHKNTGLAPSVGKKCLNLQLAAKDAENARLRAAFDAIAAGALGIGDSPATYDGDRDDAFTFWISGHECVNGGRFDTAADAALAGLAELGKDKTT